MYAFENAVLLRKYLQHDFFVFKMRGKMLGTMDKIVDAVDDPNSMMLAASATDSVTSNSDQMPTSNQVQCRACV